MSLVAATESAATADPMTSLPVATDTAVTEPSVSGRYPGYLLFWRFIPIWMHFNLIVVVVWMVVGLIGNVISVIIWLERRMRRQNSSAVYVAALSVNCVVFLVFHAFNVLSFQLVVRLYSFPVVCQAYIILYFAPQYLTQLLVLAFTVDRYIVVCHPLRRRLYCRPSRAVKVVVVLLAASLLCASVHGYIYVYDDAVERCRQRRQTTAISVFTWSTEMLFNLVAPLATIVLNVKVIRGLPGFRRSRSLEMMGGGAGDGARRKSGGQTGAGAAASKTSTTLMLLSVSFFYVATTLPMTFVYILYPVFQRGDDHMTDQQVMEDARWTQFFHYRSVELVVSALSVAHYACNFFIFIPTGRHFRQAFCDLLRCRQTAFV